LVSFFIWNWYTSNYRQFFMVALTQWSFLVLTLQSVFSMGCFIYHYFRVKNNNTDYDGIPLLFKISWVLSNISLPAALIVTLMYWTALYPIRGGVPDFGNLVVHAVNSVYAILEISITNIPVRYFHVYQCWIYAFAYGMFNLGYCLVNGGYIYPILKWNEYPAISAGVLCGMLFIVIPLVYLIVYGLYRLRLVMVSKCISRDTAPTQSVDQSVDIKIEGHSNAAYDEKHEKTETKLHTNSTQLIW